MGSPLPRKQVSGSLPFPRWYIATRLAELREAARPTPKQAEDLGLSRQRAAELVGFSPEQAAGLIGGRAASTIYDIESGKSLPQRPTLLALLDAYHADKDTTSLLLDLRREPDSHEWWEPYTGDLPGDYPLYISCEKRARAVHNFEATVIPGLLQTDDYARAVIRGTLPELSDADVERRLEVRRKRRVILAGPEAVGLHAIVDESVLNRGWTAMAGQLTALLDLPPSVTLQVMPLTVEPYPELGWPFAVVQLRDPRAPTLVFAERSAGHSVVDGDEHLRRYAGIWERLTSLALDPSESRALIAAKL